MQRVLKTAALSFFAALTVALAVFGFTAKYNFVRAEEAEPIVLTASFDWYFDDVDTVEFEINTASELYGFARLVTAGDGNGENITDFSGKTVVLASDIDLENAVFMPIGNLENPFSGIFIGDGHTVKNVNLKNCGLTDNFGFFGYVKNANISGVGIENIAVAMDSENTYTNIGGFAGNIEDSEISNCYVTGAVASLNTQEKFGFYGGFGGNIDNSRISNCYAAVDVSGGDYAGGFAGIVRKSATTIKGCFATGISANASMSIGGFTAETEGTPDFIKCYFTKNDNPSGIIGPLKIDVSFFYTASNFYEDGLDWDLIRFWDINSDKLPSFITPADDDGQIRQPPSGCSSAVFNGNYYIFFIFLLFLLPLLKNKSKEKFLVKVL